MAPVFPLMAATDVVILPSGDKPNAPIKEKHKPHVRSHRRGLMRTQLRNSRLLDSRSNFVFTRNRAHQAPAGSREGLSPLLL